MSGQPFDLAAYAASCHVNAPEKLAVRAEALRQHLVERNKVVNLTRITEKTAFDLKHAADSLSLGREFPKLTQLPLTVADLGCGGGFPALMLALAFPSWRIFAVDATAKKLAFVAAAARELHLDNVTTIHARIEELDKNPEYVGKFDLVTARAVSSAPELYAKCGHLAKPAGWYIFYKTPTQAAEDLAGLSADWQVTPPFELPLDAGTRCFLWRQA